MKDKNSMGSKEKTSRGNVIQKWHNVLFELSDWLYKIFKPTDEFSTPFKKLFFRKEIGELYGFKSSNFYKIVLLYVTLFISVGFGIQSKKYFNKQLDNPFVRYIPIPITGDASLYTEYLIDSLVQRYMQPQTKRNLKLDTIQSYSAYNPIRFLSDFVENDFIGMAANYDSDLLNNAVFNEENNVVGNRFASVEQRSVIVTLGLLKDLFLVDNNKTMEDLSPEDLPGYIMFQPDGSGDEVPLLIQAVAKQLPWENEFILPSKFNDHLFSSSSYVYQNNTNEVSFYIDTVVNSSELRELTIEIAEKHKIFADSSNLLIEKTKSLHNATLISFIDTNNDNLFEDDLKEEIKSTFDLEDKHFINAFYKRYDETGANYTAKAQQSGIFVIFNNLRKVKDFNEDLKNYSSSCITNLISTGSTRKLKGLELEMSSINLRVILNIIEIIVVAFLIIIGILASTSVVSFVRVLFEKYFQKIEKNIGTFMAFGINIKAVYIIMLMVFTITSLFFSFILAFLIGELLESIILFVLGNSVGEDVKLFNMLNYYIVLAFIVIGFANWMAFKKASAIFSEWPGDIINNRLK